MTRPTLHFVGFRDSYRYHRAIGIFGKPDFIHPRPDSRMLGEIDPDHDTVVISDDWRHIKVDKGHNPDYM